MTIILHLSDTHGEQGTIKRLDAVVRSGMRIGVVALTGDCIKVPKSWNDWRRWGMLSVPGNHDKEDTFSDIGKWTWKTPWVHPFFDLTFIGLDTSDNKNPFAMARQQLNYLGKRIIASGKALVVMSHQWPGDSDAEWMGLVMSDLSQGRPLLFLHGHEHQRKLFWNDADNMGPFKCYRSSVYSADQNRGCGHIITWDGRGFRCTELNGQLL